MSPIDVVFCIDSAVMKLTEWMAQIARYLGGQTTFRPPKTKDPSMATNWRYKIYGGKADVNTQLSAFCSFPTAAKQNNRNHGIAFSAKQELHSNSLSGDNSALRGRRIIQ